VPFLTARWTDLVLVTYAVPPETLAPHLPPDCEPDLREGSAFVSLVAFDFKAVRVRGIPWPAFSEINLRYYVRLKGRRGVAFVREFVPSRMVSFVARTLYNEPYVRAPMTSRVTDENNRRTIEHELVWAGKTHRLRAVATLAPMMPGEDSVEHFFKEHDLGCGRSRGGKLVTYIVEHPPWQVLPDAQVSLEWSFAQVYGAEWARLDGARPYAVTVAVGSEVSVSPTERRGTRSRTES
jgi:uncharacterized protein